MESLKKNEDFKRCYRTGRSFANRYLVLYVCGNGMDRNRIGISVSKKVGNSVVRHRICRLVRESYRLNEAQFQNGFDLVFIARRPAASADYHKVEGALLHLARKAGVLQERPEKKEVLDVSLKQEE